MAGRQASLSITNSQSLFKLMSIESVMPSNHLILCRPLLLLPQSFPAPGSFPMSQLFTSGGQKCWSFSFSVRSSNVCSGLIYFRVDRLDLAIQWSVKSSPTPQFKSINFPVLSFLYSPTLHPYVTTGKTIAFTRQTFVGKVMSLLLNMLSRLVINFLPRSKRLLISWLQSPSAVILEPQK